MEDYFGIETKSILEHASVPKHNETENLIEANISQEHAKHLPKWWKMSVYQPTIQSIQRTMNLKDANT